MWKHTLPYLDGFDVVTPDLLGHGNRQPAEPGTSLADLGTDVARQLPGPVHLVGFSLGALVSQWMATNMPEMALSLTLVSSVANRSPQQRTAVEQRLALAETDHPLSVEQALDRWFPAEFRTRNPGIVAEVRKQLLSNDHDSYLSCYRVFINGDAEVADDLPLIRVPTLVITGEHDSGSTPEMAQWLSETIPTADPPIIVPGAHHLLPVEHPDEAAAAVRTMARQDTEPPSVLPDEAAALVNRKA